MFFVLSGYLITDILCTQWTLSGRINYLGFWLRRIKRLMPAVAAMVVAVLAWTAHAEPERLPDIGKDALAALFYVSNWQFLFHQVSYFASFGPPSPFGHLWSLAIEGQFYLVWPLLLGLGLRYVPKRKFLAGLVLTGAMASAGAMMLIYEPGTDPSRVYYGTDTRAFSLLLGAALALLMPSRSLSKPVSAKARHVLDVLGAAGLLLVLLMIWRTNEYEAFLYRGGLLLFSMASVAAAAAMVVPGSRLGRLLGFWPLKWLGVRSYSIYLWHYPVIVLTNPVVNTRGLDVHLVLWQFVLSIVLGALSYRFIEEPFRRGYWKNWVTAKRLYLSAGVSCLAVGVFAFNVSPAVEGSDSSVERYVAVPAIDPYVATPVAEQQPAAPPVADNSPLTGISTVPPSSVSVTAPDVISEAGKGVTVIGDSVMLGAEDALKKVLPGIEVNAEVGRQFKQTTELVEQLQSEGKLGERVVLQLGTNGPFTGEQLTELLQSLGQPQDIILVNTRVPRPWEGVVNQTIEQVAGEFPQTRLADWYAASTGHDDYFYKDGVHLTPVGAEAYAVLIATAVNPAM